MVLPQPEESAAILSNAAESLAGEQDGPPRMNRDGPSQGAASGQRVTDAEMPSFGALASIPSSRLLSSTNGSPVRCAL